ncbi:hypothetical protein OYT88_20515 [Sporolactobacillus sp. CQH2019]|uniref:hypothetical protein n=1 Tax=Sporolactobacillus sp. CQH2019 TaxID=3023512 RepID=UPI0023681544|nr:hypothetical protein [Sporolactobacillus sp. CQH2019]MDD9150905.1 hypothetical protein [Sporolactobacillus sp. CQH2019]
MNFIKKGVITLIFASFIMLFNGWTLTDAYTGYAGADGDLSYATAQAKVTKAYLDQMGYYTTLYTGSSYTEASVKNNVPSVRAFYTSCHGSSNASAFWTNNASESVTSSELYSWTVGFYKFAFIDACHSGESKAMYSAFNMVDNDGKSDAYLGWIGLSYDSANYTNFTTAVYELLDQGETINSAVWTARTRTGITNYQIYGDYQMTMY